MKTFYKFVILIIVTVTVACGNQVQAQTIQDRSISFDMGWRFSRDSIVNAEQPTFNDSKWRGLDLPHDGALRER